MHPVLVLLCTLSLHSHSAFAQTCYCPKRGCYCSQADGFVTSSQHALGYAFAPSLCPHRYKTASAQKFTEQNSLLGDLSCLVMAVKLFCFPGLAHRSGAWALKRPLMGACAPHPPVVSHQMWRGLHHRFALTGGRSSPP